jgi:hypothetical protein
MLIEVDGTSGDGGVVVVGGARTGGGGGSSSGADSGVRAVSGVEWVMPWTLIHTFVVAFCAFRGNYMDATGYPQGLLSMSAAV